VTYGISRRRKSEENLKSTTSAYLKRKVFIKAQPTYFLSLTSFLESTAEIVEKTPQPVDEEEVESYG